MSKSAKPRKAHREKPIHVPMMTENRDALALQMHTAVETLIQRPSVDSYNRISKMLATMTYAGMKADCLNMATDTVNAVCDRFDRVQAIGLSDKEAETLRAMAGELDWMIGKIPSNVFKAAAATVNYNFDAMHKEQDAA
jgi:hypothetical protein